MSATHSYLYAALVCCFLPPCKISRATKHVHAQHDVKSTVAPHSAVEEFEYALSGKGGPEGAMRPKRGRSSGSYDWDSSFSPASSGSKSLRLYCSHVLHEMLLFLNIDLSRCLTEACST